jgi:hypothetical protein
MQLRDMAHQVVVPLDLLPTMGTLLLLSHVDGCLVPLQVPSCAEAYSPFAAALVPAAVPLAVAAFVLASLDQYGVGGLPAD